MKKCRLSELKQGRLMERFAVGTTARYAAKLVGVNCKTAAYYYHHFRKIIFLSMEEESPFTGEIELDESYILAHEKVSADGVLLVRCPYLEY